MPKLPLLSYIAHVKELRKEHLDYAEDLTQRGFPCVISNQFNNDKDTASEAMLNRLTTIANDSNRFVIFFIEDSAYDNIALWELGLASSYGHCEFICLIGKEKYRQFAQLPRVKSYPNWEGFIGNHFFS